MIQIPFLVNTVFIRRQVLKAKLEDSDKVRIFKVLLCSKVHFVREGGITGIDNILVFTQQGIKYTTRYNLKYHKIQRQHEGKSKLAR